MVLRFGNVFESSAHSHYLIKNLILNNIYQLFWCVYLLLIKTSLGILNGKNDDKFFFQKLSKYLNLLLMFLSFHLFFFLQYLYSALLYYVKLFFCFPPLQKVLIEYSTGDQTCSYFEQVSLISWNVFDIYL